MSGECDYCGEHATDCECECDYVNHPPHYQGLTFEAIEVIEDFELNFNLGNVIKYILRCGKKDDAIEDLRKAQYYLTREINHRRTNHG